MIKNQKVLDKTIGLNTILDPFQSQDEIDSNGNSKPNNQFAKAVNIKITDSNVAERSEPTTHLIDLTNGHSIFCDGGAALVHDDGSMYEINSDLSLSAAKRTWMSGNQISHTQAGDAVYFSNLFENGVYYGNAAISWQVDQYRGPETNRYFVDHVPFFEKIAYFNGYMLGAIGNALYASELGLLGLFEMKPVWLSNSDIIMIKPVVTDTFPPSSGVYVSDRSKITYLGGTNPRSFAEPRTTNYPAIEWAVAHGLVDGALFGEKSGLCAVFSTSKGDCIGYPDGQLVNIHQNKIKIPAGLSIGATAIIDHNIISTLR